MSICNLHEYDEPIPALYRVIADKPNAGGIVNLADYCPYLQVGPQANCQVLIIAVSLCYCRLQFTIADDCRRSVCRTLKELSAHAYIGSPIFDRLNMRI